MNSNYIPTIHKPLSMSWFAAFAAITATMIFMSVGVILILERALDTDIGFFSAFVISSVVFLAFDKLVCPAIVDLWITNKFADEGDASVPEATQQIASEFEDEQLAKMSVRELGYMRDFCNGTLRKIDDLIAERSGE